MLAEEIAEELRLANAERASAKAVRDFISSNDAFTPYGAWVALCKPVGAWPDNADFPLGYDERDSRL